MKTRDSNCLGTHSTGDRFVAFAVVISSSHSLRMVCRIARLIAFRSRIKNLARKDRLFVYCNPSEERAGANSTTRRFSTGNAPGRPRQTGHVLEWVYRQNRRAAAENF